ncbi:MAG: YeeE/YedE family protein, partial [Desulfobulbaceae bacterium]|nr:YeeE/YedE family protein [Desulfobulbaceae bacterium]
MTIDATILIAVLSLLIGIAAGFVMHRSDYCVTGMFRDAVMFGDTFMLRSLCLQIVATMLLFEVLRRVGLLPLYPFPLLDKPSLATLAGGFLFGIGMVLAGGCVVGTLYKLGAGSVTSLAALFGLILGSGLYAEIHLQWSGFAKATTLSETLTIPQMLRLDPAVLIIAVALPAALLFHRWRRRHAWERETVASGYLQPWKAGLILAVLGAISYVNVAMPLGISTTYAKLAAMLATLVVPAHVESLAF